MSRIFRPGCAKFVFKAGSNEWTVVAKLEVLSAVLLKILRSCARSLGG